VFNCGNGRSRESCEILESVSESVFKVTCDGVHKKLLRIPINVQAKVSVKVSLCDCKRVLKCVAHI
jgi:hypothetical protein